MAVVPRERARSRRRELRAYGMASFRIVSVNTSALKGTVKTPVPGAVADTEGLAGDAHRGVPGRGVSILDIESIEAFAREAGIEAGPGDFGENLTTRGIDLGDARPGDRITAGGARLVVTAIGKTCHGDGCAIFRKVGRCVMPSRGVFCRVEEGGFIAPGSEGSLDRSGEPPKPSDP